MAITLSEIQDGNLEDGKYMVYLFNPSLSDNRIYFIDVTDNDVDDRLIDVIPVLQERTDWIVTGIVKMRDDEQ